VTLLKTALEAMLSRAVADREEMVNLLNRTYKLTPMTDVLALNTVLRSLQDKVVQWEYVIDGLEGRCLS
jgi:1-phosphatidylinositol-3-phosphate 5-kinase